MAVVMPMEDFPYLPSGPAEVNKMIKEHGDLFSDSQCKVCIAVLNSESQKLTHYQSKKHANKVRRYFSIQNDMEPAVKKVKTSITQTQDCNNGDTDRDKVCHVCNMTFSARVVAESHYQGKVHAKNLRLKAAGPKTPAPQAPVPAAQPKKKASEEPGDTAASGNDDPNRFCSTCQASFNNPLMAKQHYEGKKHKKKMTKLKLMETYGPSTAPGQTGASTVKGYPCTVCNIELNSVEQYQAHISGAKHKNQMKKSGSSPAEKQTNPEQQFGEDLKLSGEENQFSGGENQLSGGDSQFSGGENQFCGGGEDQFSGGENMYSAAYTEEPLEEEFHHT